MDYLRAFLTQNSFSIKMNLTDRFVEGLYAFSNRSFSKEDICHAKKCLIDYLGVTYAGAKVYNDVEKALLSNFIFSEGNALVLGHNIKTTASLAALINGISAHAVELDDGQRFGNIHPGAPIISALLSIIGSVNVSSEDLLRGILTGYECSLRLACNIQPGHKLKGFHATGPCGTIGATMAIAAMLRFNKEQYKTALSVACTNASGILEMIEGDTQMMPYNSGKAASNAIIAASTALSGFKVPIDALGGNRGFLKCFADQPNIENLVDFDSLKYYDTNYFKLYAACGHCHSAIESSLILRSKHQFRIEEIESIDIQTYKLALKGHDHNIINGVNSARMSIPYSAAVALLRGSADIEDFDEKTIQCKDILDLTSKISVKENEELTSRAPKERIALVTVHTKRGDFVESVAHPKGQPENPLTMEDILSKFSRLLEFAEMPKEKSEMIKSCILEDTFNTSELLSLL